MSKTQYTIVNKRTGKERPVASARVLSPLGEIRMDGWANLITGLGTNADKRTASNVTWAPLTMEQYEQAYSGDDQFARIVDIVPNDALREWLEPTGKDPNTGEPISHKVLEACKDRLAKLDVRGSCERTWKWARAFGGALQYIVTDCVDPAMPLDVQREQVLSLRELSRYDLRILTTDIETDFGSENFGRPNIYYLNVQVGTNVKLYPIHWTRVIRYDGKLVPRRTYIRNNYWHDSELQRLFNVIRNYQTSNDAAASILQDFNVGKFKMKDLANLMQSDKGQQLVKQRMDMVNYAKSTIRAMILDADGEDFEDSSRNVTGLPEMLDHQARRYVAATDIPHTKMLGESPDGSNATGNSTMQLWFQYIRAEQNNYLRPKLEKLFSVLFWDIPGLNFKFNKLHHLTEKEEAEIRKINAECDAVYLDHSVLDPTEVAKSRFGGEEYGEQIKLDMEARKQGLFGTIQEKPDFEGGLDEEQPGANAPDSGQPSGNKNREDGDFPLEEGLVSQEAPEREYNPWEEEGEEKEEALPQSLQERPLNPMGVEIPREGGQWNPRNNQIPSQVKKQHSFITQTESLPFRDPKTDPKMPPPGRKPTRIPDYEGKYSAAGGSQKAPANWPAQYNEGTPADPSVRQRGDASESSLMPLQLDSIKKAPYSEKQPDMVPQKMRGRVHGTSVVVRAGDFVLLGKRRDSGKWALPGGRCEPGETAKLTARRELWEETGLRTTRLTFMKQHDAGDATVSTFQCILLSPTNVDPSQDPDHEFTELTWVNVRDGLPAEIAGNLHHSPNLALLDVGLGHSST